MFDMSANALAQLHVDLDFNLPLQDIPGKATLTPEQRLQLIAGDPHAFDHGTLGPELHLQVVGVFRGATDVAGATDVSDVELPHNS